MMGEGYNDSDNIFIPFTREDGTVEMRHKDYDKLVQERAQPPEEYFVIPQEEVDLYYATLYRQQRIREYPSIGDQLDALFHAGVFPEDMAAKIQAVKEKYPKPIE